MELKLTILIIMVCVTNGLATTTYSQSAKVSLDMKNTSLEKVMDDIEKQSEFYFIFNQKQIDVNRVVDIHAENKLIADILPELFKGTDVNYLIIDKKILLTTDPMQNNLLGLISGAELQQIRITGTVTDATNGGPVPGVSVVVTGTTIGTMTDMNGRYTIQVPQGSNTLTYSFIGMKPQVVSIDARSIIDVAMEIEIIGIEEVVVTALGIKREEKALGYSVQKVSGESLQKVSVVDVATSLTGKVAGLLVKNSSDFGTAPVMSIRGEQPLLVIDGVAYQNKTLSDISAEDIESMSVLKGATASALYGFRGASGAILITTKNGSTNAAGITVDFATNTMFTAGFLAIPEKQSVYGRGNNNTYDKNNTSAWGTTMDGKTILQWDPILLADKESPYLPVGANNFANFLEQGYVTNNNINIGYKGDIASLRSSFNWTQNKGQYPNNVLNKYTYAFGGDINLGKFKLSSNLSYSKKASPNMGSNGYTSYDPMYSLLIWASADFNILDYKDNYWLVKDQVQNYTYAASANMNNPYFDRYEKTNPVSRDLFNADVTMSYQFSDWLTASIRSGLDFYTDKGEIKVAWGSYLMSGNTPVPGNLYTWSGYKTGGYVIGQTQGISMNNDLLLTGNKSFDKINVEYIAGGTIFYKKDDNINSNTNGGISVPAFYSLKASVSPATVNQSTYGQQVNSLFGRVAVSWNRLIYLEATGRNDWSSTMPADSKSYFYPSVAGSFVVSELLPGTKNWLDLLKVRSSWTMSKTPPAIYGVNSVYGINSSTWNTLNGAYPPGSLYGSNIVPQSANTFEIGLQGIVYKNRLMVDVTYYNKHMYDFLKNAPVSPATGYSSNYINIDEEIDRKGWELAVTGSPIKSEDWQLDLGLNWSTYARYYAKLDSVYSSTKPWVKVGKRVDALVSRDFVIVPETGELICSSSGRLQYSGYDSNFGWTDPDWLWGANATLRYKAFSLFLSFDGVVGGLMNTRTESYMWQSGVHPDGVTPERALDVATPGSTNYLVEGVQVASGTVTYDANGVILTDTRTYKPNDVKTTYSRYAIDLHNSSAWGGAGSPADTYSKTFFKLREMSLTYNVPTNLTKGIARAASVSFVGQNVLLWAKDFKYSDPDGGVEDFADPAVRYLGFNIKLTF